MSPPGLSKDQIGLSRGRGFFVHSRADGHEVGGSGLINESLADKWILNASFNRPAFLNGSWYVSHFSDFVKADTKGAQQDYTRLWRVLPVLGLDNVTIGPFLFKDRLICGNAPYEGGKKAVVFAFDKEGGKDWKEYVDDTASGVGSITANSDRLFVATNFHVKALDEKGNEKWDQVNSKGGLYPGKYRGLRFYQNHGARKSQGQFIVADEKNVYVATHLGDKQDALTVLNAKSGEYVGSLDLGTYVSDMAIVGAKIALATDDGLRLLDLL
jgi:outer membrane protein assembly factor BamB